MADKYVIILMTTTNSDQLCTSSRVHNGVSAQRQLTNLVGSEIS